MPEKLTYPKYSLKDVAKYNGQEDSEIWMVIKDSVYNVTDYMADHPGGSELISEYAGRDATSGFNDFGHSTDATKILKRFKVGELIEEDQRKNRRNKMKENNVNKKRKVLTFSLFRNCTN